MVDVNEFVGSCDNEIIEQAIQNRGKDGIVVIPPRVSQVEPERDWWLLDRAILLPENTTVILRSCTIKLSDRCRDNFFRSANCGMGIGYPEKIRNIHIRGEGISILHGADHPRATGDGSKILANPCPYLTEDLCRLADWVPEDRKKSGKLVFADTHDHSYGTDVGAKGEWPKGDWRGIGILLANVEEFSIENIRIVDAHGWCISLEACTHGSIRRIDFDNRMCKEIDGMLQNMENQDGIDLRPGCHHIIISDITGRTGDDVIALNCATRNEVEPGGAHSTHVMDSDWSRRERDIHDIIIRNVVAESSLCYVIRLLTGRSKMWNVIIDGVIDTAPADRERFGGIVIGCAKYGVVEPDSIFNVTLSNVILNSRNGIVLKSYLKDSLISNVINRHPEGTGLVMQLEDSLDNVKVVNLLATEEIHRDIQ